MAISGDIRVMGNDIAQQHGRWLFNFGQVAKMIGCGKNHVAHLFHEAGITVKRQGTAKMVDAYDIAEYILRNRIAPIDNTPK